MPKDPFHEIKCNKFEIKVCISHKSEVTLARFIDEAVIDGRAEKESFKKNLTNILKGVNFFSSSVNHLNRSNDH